MSAPIFILSGVENPKKMPVISNHRDVANLFNVPFLLQGKAPLQNANEIIKSRDRGLIIVDSGGKQLAEINMGRSKKYKRHDSDGSKPIRVGSTLHLAPQHLAEAVLKLAHVDILMALDDPIAPNKNPDERDSYFHAKLQRNVEWVRQTVNLKNRFFPHVKIFLPVQCQTLDHFEVFWRKVKKLDLAGLSLPERCFKNAQDLLPLLRRFSEIGIQGFHFLGSSRLEIIALLCLLGRHNVFEHLAFDSTSWMQASIRSRIMVPYSLAEVSIVEDKFDKVTKMLISQDNIYKKMDITKIPKFRKEDQRQILRTLNVRAIIKTKREIYKYALSAESICTFLKSKSVNLSKVDKIFNLLSSAENIFRAPYLYEQHNDTL